MRRSFLLLLAALPLAACGSGSGTSISIKAEGETNAAIDSDANGQVAIKAPGFEGSLKLPAVDISAEDFDVNGMRIYPGSKIREFNVEGEDRPGRADQGKVVVAFDSPAPLATVHGWFRDALTKRGFKVEERGDGFAGTTSDGDSFSLTLAARGARTDGRMQVGS